MSNSIGDLLRQPPEAFKPGEDRVSINHMHLRTGDGKRASIRRPTPALKGWLSGKSRLYSDLVVADWVGNGVTAARVMSWRTGNYPDEWEAKRLEQLFSYPASHLPSLLYVYGVKHYRKMFESAFSGRGGPGDGWVIALVPRKNATRGKWPILGIVNHAERLSGIFDLPRTQIEDEIEVSG